MVPRIDLDGTQIAIAGNPVKVAGDMTEYAPAPVLGADGPAILRERLGYDDARIAGLRASGAVG